MTTKIEMLASTCGRSDGDLNGCEVATRQLSEAELAKVGGGYIGPKSTPEDDPG